MTEDTFWVQSLFNHNNIIPSKSMGHGERLNSITRFILLISIIMIFIFRHYAVWFFILGIILLVILDYINTPSSHKTDDYYICDNPLICPVETKKKQFKLVDECPSHICLSQPTKGGSHSFPTLHQLFPKSEFGQR
jgi:hypothetical protein